MLWVVVDAKNIANQNKNKNSCSILLHCINNALIGAMEQLRTSAKWKGYEAFLCLNCFK
jgi:hypothetical protein